MIQHVAAKAEANNKLVEKHGNSGMTAKGFNVPYGDGHRPEVVNTVGKHTQGGRANGEGRIVDQAGLAQAWKNIREASSSGACNRFRTHDKRLDVALDTREKGFKGGQWSACTHLKEYGLNFAPFVARFLAYQLAPATALEFGCGLGTTSDYVGRFSGADVTCIEPEATLGELIMSLRDQPGKGNLNQLALNIFENDKDVLECKSTLKKDLVFSFEVAEHIPVQHRPALVTFLSESAGKWLVFSAARPDQKGTGHIPESMITPDEWRRLFEEKGLVFMPNLTEMVRQTAYPLRNYDIFSNTLVFRSPENRASDTDVPHEMLAKFRNWWGSGLNTPEWAKDLSNWATGHETAIWPELTLKMAQVKAGEECNQPTKASPPAAASLLATGGAINHTKPILEMLAFESAWAAHFHGSQH